MSSNDDQPKPIDTTHVHLPLEVEELTKLLARNAHDNWSQQRIAGGWQMGLAAERFAEAASVIGGLWGSAGI